MGAFPCLLLYQFLHWLTSVEQIFYYIIVVALEVVVIMKATRQLRSESGKYIVSFELKNGDDTILLINKQFDDAFAAIFWMAEKSDLLLDEGVELD